MAIDSLIAESFLSDEVIAQIGYGGYIPQHMPWVSTMPRSVYSEYIRNSVAVISHAGMGTIIECLQIRKPILLTPRLSRQNEHVNDHQIGTARKFEERGSVLVAYHTAELPRKITELRSFRPFIGALDSRKTLVDHINGFLENLEGGV